jgi:hypothetical protein
MRHSSSVTTRFSNFLKLSNLSTTNNQTLQFPRLESYTARLRRQIIWKRVFDPQGRRPTALDQRASRNRLGEEFAFFGCLYSYCVRFMVISYLNQPLGQILAPSRTRRLGHRQHSFILLRTPSTWDFCRLTLRFNSCIYAIHN